MATPAVAGLAALVWSNHSSCTGEDIRAALKATAQDGGAAGKDDKFGYGIVKAADANAYLANNPCGATPPPPTGDFTMTATGFKSKGKQNVNLTWSGTEVSNVDIYRDGNLIITTLNDGAYTDALNIKGGGSYLYEICEEGTSTCTATVQVIF